MMVTSQAREHVETALHAYCESMDDADFESFAALFQKGQWFMVGEPGSSPVLAWLQDNIILHEGKTLTRHEVSNLLVSVSDRPDEVAFRCYVAIWQALPGAAPQLLAHARFRGTFRQIDETWWWWDHDMSSTYAGDLSAHIRGGLVAVPLT